MHNIASGGTTDRDIEVQIQAKGLTHPRVTPADIDAVIASVHYFTAGDGVDGADIAQLRAKEPTTSFHLQPLVDDTDTSKTTVIGPLGLLTFCVIVFNNGFTVTGESACASPENFDAEIGKKIAFENAKQKIWPLLGYKLKCDLHEAKTHG